MTIVTTSPAVPRGPSRGLSQATPESAATCSEVTTTGRDTVAFDVCDFSRLVLMSSIVS